MAYSNFYRAEDLDDMKEYCQYCVTSLHDGYPSMKEKLKIHLLLHLIEDMENFGHFVLNGMN